MVNYEGNDIGSRHCGLSFLGLFTIVLGSTASSQMEMTSAMVVRDCP